jgi:hypothetical protein
MVPMRFALACLAALVVAVPAAARVDPSVRAPATVTVLAGEGKKVAFLAAAANGGCGAVRTWTPPSIVVRSSKVVCGPRTSTGRGVYGLSISGGVPLWVTYTGGNIREHSVWRGGRRIAFIGHDVDSPSSVLVGEHGSYAVGRRVTVFTNAGRRSWNLDEPPLGLSAGAPFAVARVASGAVERVDAATGVVDARWDYAKGEARAAKISGSQVVVLRVGQLDVYSSSRDTMRSWPVPAARSYGDDYCGSVRCALAALRLADFRGELAVYMEGRDLHVLRVTDGTDVVMRRPLVGPVHAQLESSGLFYSAGRKVFFIPRAQLDRRLRSG